MSLFRAFRASFATVFLLAAMAIPTTAVRADWDCNTAALTPVQQYQKFNVDHVLDGLNPFALLTNKVFGVSHVRLAPTSFFEDDGLGSIVGINGVSRYENYRDAADYMTGKQFASLPHVFQERATSPNDLIEELLANYRAGGPIHKLVIAAHGTPGSFSVGGKSFNLKWVESQSGRFKVLPKDLFGPNAIVVLISCSTARGSYGRESLREMFTPLLKQGGKVIASTRYVDPQLSQIPGAYKNILDRITRHAINTPIISIMESISWLFSDWRSKISKVIEIEIPATP